MQTPKQKFLARKQKEAKHLMKSARHYSCYPLDVVKTKLEW